MISFISWIIFLIVFISGLWAVLRMGDPIAKRAQGKTKLSKKEGDLSDKKNLRIFN